MKTIYTYTTLLYLSCSLCLAQKEANIWYFGDGAGLDFNNDTVVALTDGKITSDGAGATISDKNGNLLFYTDGVTVWNANHDTMPNGKGLLGRNFGDAPAIIIPQPRNDSLYYIFTVDAPTDTNRVSYSIVNMKLDSGRGDIIPGSKNILLLSPAASKLTAAHHKNNCGTWIITHEWRTDSFYVYLISDTGISQPVVSEVGRRHSGNLGNIQGQITISPDGRKLALALKIDKIIELFDFDNTSGVISNLLSLSPLNISPAPLSFSPDNSKLYVSGIFLLDSVFQFDLSIWDSSTIQSSKVFIQYTEIGLFQIATDGKIYRSRRMKDSIGVFMNPNEMGFAANYIENGVYLLGKICKDGLPNFIQSYFNPTKPSFTFTFDTVCTGSPTAFTGIHPYQVNSWLWNFGDTASPNNTDTAQNPIHTYTDTGSYTVQLAMAGMCKTDTVTKTVYVQPNYLADNLGDTVFICFGDTAVALDAGNAGSSYLWSTGDTSATLSVPVADTGTYWVQVTDKGCMRTDTVTVSRYPEILVSLANDTSLCGGDSLLLDAGNAGAAYLWSTGDTSATLSVHAADSGMYWVSVTYTNGCAGTDTLAIALVPNPVVALGNDTAICINTAITLDAGNPGAGYLWSTGDISATLSVPAVDTGTYSVTVTDINGCKAGDTIVISQTAALQVSLGNDTTICKGATLTLNAGNTGATYLWSTGDTSATLSVPVADTGTYWVQVTDNGCKGHDTIAVSQYPSINVNPGNDTTIASGSSIILYGETAGGVSYQWSPAKGLNCTGCANPIASPETTTTYILAVTDAYGCTDTSSITIAVNEQHVIFIPNFFTPNGDEQNDVLYVMGKGIKSIKFTIFNRFGVKIFETTDVTVGWDGTYKGQPMNQAVFVYEVTGRFTNGDVIDEIGNVTLIR